MPQQDHPRRPRATRRKGAKYVVFVSHSSRDNWIARAMAERIRALGAEVWLDEKHLEGGDVIVEKIIKGIDACAEALVLVSPHSAQSQWVAFEIGAVRGQHKRVTPILNGVAPEAIAPMKDVSAIELNQFDRFLKQLQKRIAGD
jgi:predicted nucleotide-binding protein